MSIVLDIILVLIVTLTVIIYCKRGFVRDILGFGKSLLSMIFAFVFGDAVGRFISSRFISPKITESVYNTLSGICHKGDQIFDISGFVQKLPESLRKLAEICGVQFDTISKNVADDTAVGADRLAEIASSVADPISSVISDLLGYILVFVAAYLLLLVGSFVIEKVAELPVIRFFNRILGFCFGLVSAGVFAFVYGLAAKVIIYWIAASGDQSAAFAIIDNTHIFKLLFGTGI